MAEESAIVKTQYDGTVALVDGAGTSYTIPCSVALDVSGLQPGGREVIAVEARGVVKSLRKGKKVFPTGSIEVYLTGLSDATKTTLLDFIFGTAYYSASTSTTTAMGDVRTADIVLTIEGTDLGDSADHVLTMEDCYLSVGIKEGEPNTISGSFTCYGSYSRT
jgi:hypothetical protein